MGSCVRCTAPATTTLCGTCILALKIELSDVAGIIPSATINGQGHDRGTMLPGLTDELDTSLSRQDQLTDPRNTSRAPNEAPMIYRDRVSEAIWVLHQVFQKWATTTGADPHLSPRELAHWFLRHLDVVQRAPDAADLADEITDAIHQARRAIDRPDDRRIYLGHCGSVLGSPSYSGYQRPACREELYAYPWDTETVTCTACATTYRITSRREWLRDLADQHPATSVEVAGFLCMIGVQCTPGQIRGYAHRHRLTPVGCNDRGHPTYLIGDVLAAIQNRYTRHDSVNQP